MKTAAALALLLALSLTGCGPKESKEPLTAAQA